MNDIIRNALRELYFVESKEDIQKFIDKFGQDTFELFNKSKQRLINNKISTDYTYHVKNTSKEELDSILDRLQRKVSVSNDSGSTNGGIRGKYKFLGEKDGYKVYQPLDALSSMDLGYMTGWCTTGRYGHAGEKDFKPSLEHAKEHFNSYVDSGIHLYYFLNSKMEGQYAIASNETTVDVKSGNNYITVNFELFNQQDNHEYSAFTKLPTDLIPEDLIYEVHEPNTYNVEDGVLTKYYKGNETEVFISDDVTVIDEHAFYNCDELEYVSIPDSVTTIRANAFAFCNKLQEISIPESVTFVDFGAFKNCGATRVEIFGNLETIESKCFYNCFNLKSVKLPDGLKIIDSSAFLLCGKLEKISIPYSVVEIGEEAFEYCKGLTYIEFGSNLKTIKSGAFNGCVKLNTVNFIGSVDEWTQIDFEGKYATPLNYAKDLHINGNLLTTADIKSSTDINNYSFYGCKSLKNVILNKDVVSIGDKAFFGCSGLTSIEYKGPMVLWDSIIKGSDWDSGVPQSCIIKCTDGTVNINK